MPISSSNIHSEASYETVRVLTLADTTIITAGASSIQVRYIQFSNNNPDPRRVTLKFGAAGDVRFTATLAGDGGSINMNLISAYWRGTAGLDLIANLDADDADGVDITVGYKLKG